MARAYGIPEKLLIALGGNAIHPEGIRGTGQEQFAMAAAAAQALLPVLQSETRLVITHGNGPGVGKVLMRQAIAKNRVAIQPLDICVANSQGGISYVIMQALQNALRSIHHRRPVASLVCEVEVNPDDPAFANPDKPLGYFFSEAEARDLEKEFGWIMKEDAKRGWRMVVPSPQPHRVIDSDIINTLMRQGVIVITGGGGGIPVTVDAGNQLRGVEAVIDKDLTSALLARQLGIDDLLILTSVDRVKIHFGTPQEQSLDELSLDELKSYEAEGHFSAGSMGPKIGAVRHFLEAGGRRAIIADLKDAYDALLGRTGTRVIHP
ncbi:carbamate kinase [Desulfofustis limnaeus]|jgi:carbamate kinase|uniref:Carbamate kinase n=1 Tax=Desulfofustis limnaeus TaxID=2740163 RepID=A0ABM7WAB7_9BACT|nr:carbamate kinase [Desulfofustis limnaeus]MDX9895532.1 carbamate kinase [Desulfofustis sp.]BDD87941.1 carbamate kinase [Desulfofustis limnaeus]